MVTLNDAIRAAQTDLRTIEGVNLVLPLSRLQTSILLGNGKVSVAMVKSACEAILDCAHDAEDAGNTDVADRLRGIVRMLSPVVARS